MYLRVLPEGQVQLEGLYICGYCQRGIYNWKIYISAGTARGAGTIGRSMYLRVLPEWHIQLEGLYICGYCQRGIYNWKVYISAGTTRGAGTIGRLALRTDLLGAKVRHPPERGKLLLPEPWQLNLHIWK